MVINLKNKLGTGILPQQFIEEMKSNQVSFLDWYNRFTWSSEEDVQFFRSLRGRADLKCLILCTDWCPDVIWNAPVLFRVLEYAEIAAEVLPMEQHLDTMDQFLTDGGRAQPIAIFVNPEGAVLGQWGPRPEYIQEVMRQFRRDNPDRDAPDYPTKIEEIRKEIAAMYNVGTNYQSVIVRELRELITALL